MDNRIDTLLQKINNLSNIYQNLDDSCACINLEDINDVKIFNVEEININILANNFNDWIAVEDANINNDDYLSVFPQVKITYLENNLYKITFEFYGYDELIGSVEYKLCTASIKYILNNLLYLQMNISDVMLNNMY